MYFKKCFSNSRDKPVSPTSCVFLNLPAPKTYSFWVVHIKALPLPAQTPCSLKAGTFHHYLSVLCAKCRAQHTMDVQSVLAKRAQERRDLLTVVTAQASVFSSRNVDKMTSQYPSIFHILEWINHLWGLGARAILCTHFPMPTLDFSSHFIYQFSHRVQRSY